MAKKIFVAGLDYGVSDEQLEELFSQYGQVVSARVITDHDTGKSKGFGFVEMTSDEDLSNAVSSLHETQFEGRTLVVKEARPKGEFSHNNKPRNNSFGNKGRGSFGRKF